MDSSRVRELVAAMTLEEKASLCSGRDFWHTKSVERLGVPSWMMTDGPHGLRKQSSAPDQLGLNATVPATCFPTGAALASTWNPALVEEVGAALGRESQAEAVGVILGPALNIKRSPLCGRNFEYLSEDPFLAGEIASHHVKGVQSQGVGASIKHFAANNQERLRMTIDVIVDERTLREIYLPAFEAVVKESRPWTVMCAYNRLNGTFCSQNRWLLTSVLRDEWGFDGVVMTDWGACDDRVAGLQAGQDLEMPYSGPANDAAIVAAVRAGRLDEKVLDRTVERNLGLTSCVMESRRSGATFDAAAHHALARRVAGESAVLLKNAGGLLPLRKQGRIAFLGDFAKHPRYQGGGSSHMRPTRLDSAWDEAVRALAGKAELTYAAGVDGAEPVPELLEEARKTAAAADVAVVFVGLTDEYESEGFDRRHLRVPESHAALIRAVAAAQKNVVVVLSNGAPIEMPWLADVAAVLEGYLGGQAGGSAAVDLLFGDVNPSGRLAETFPLRVEDTPCFVHFPGGKDAVEYREGLFVGYRYYDSVGASTLFPFGHGLSYTRFEYVGLSLDKERMSDADELAVSVTVRNAGDRAGQEVVQVYVHDEECSVVRPNRELKGFAKVALDPGQTRTVRITLGKRAFAYWDATGWRVEAGRFEVQVGASVKDIRLKAPVWIEETAPRPRAVDRNSTVADLLGHPRLKDVADELLARIRHGMGLTDPNPPEYPMMNAMVRELPLRNLPWMAGRAFSRETIAALADVANGRTPATALRSLLQEGNTR